MPSLNPLNWFKRRNDAMSDEQPQQTSAIPMIAPVPAPPAPPPQAAPPEEASPSATIAAAVTAEPAPVEDVKEALPEHEEDTREILPDADAAASMEFDLEAILAEADEAMTAAQTADEEAATAAANFRDALAEANATNQQWQQFSERQARDLDRIRGERDRAIAAVRKLTAILKQRSA